MICYRYVTTTTTSKITTTTPDNLLHGFWVAECHTKDSHHAYTDAPPPPLTTTTTSTTTTTTSTTTTTTTTMIHFYPLLHPSLRQGVPMASTPTSNHQLTLTRSCGDNQLECMPRDLEGQRERNTRPGHEWF